ncbi:MAG TPA: DUF2330 domain-containing protein [Acidimicrobiales bacterium]|nr:DUF2330 domain-containing protein [Acidimicrobiales bacterium]
MARRWIGLFGSTGAALLAIGVLAGPALACAGLVTPGGNVRLLRTGTLAAYHAGVEHYITSFRFEGGGAEFGSIVPLPGIPSDVERGGDWTLQRLDREVNPPQAFAGAASGGALAASPATVIEEKRIDALDITILKGGGASVGDWARQHGYKLTPDAPEVLDFYAERSPIFMAARFDAAAARERGQQEGDGTPIHLTIPVSNPWVPLRILGLGDSGDSRIDANVYLLTDRAPALLPQPGTPLGFGLIPLRSEQASTQLLSDLRTDKGMEWVPQSMWFTAFRVGEQAGRLRYDLAIDASGRGHPSLVAAGLRRPAKPAPPTTRPVPTRPPSTVAPTTVTSPPEVALGPPADQLLAPRRAAAESAPVDLGLALAGVGALAGAALATTVIARRRLIRR